MYEAYFEGLLYNIFSEETLKNQIIHMTEENDDYTISNYVYQNLGMLVGEKITCLSCPQNNRPKV